MQIGIVEVAVWIAITYITFYAFVVPMLFRPYFRLRMWAKLLLFYPLCIITAPAALPYFIFLATVAFIDWIRYTAIPAIEPHIRH